MVKKLGFGILSYLCTFTKFSLSPGFTCGCLDRSGLKPCCLGICSDSAEALSNDLLELIDLILE
jgi:hypothetical protein